MYVSIKCSGNDEDIINLSKVTHISKNDDEIKVWYGNELDANDEFILEFDSTIACNKAYKQILNALEKYEEKYGAKIKDFLFKMEG